MPLFFLFSASHLLYPCKPPFLLLRSASVCMYRSGNIRSRKVNVGLSLWRHHWISGLLLLIHSDIKEVKVKRYYPQDHQICPNRWQKNRNYNGRSAGNEDESYSDQQNSLLAANQLIPQIPLQEVSITPCVTTYAFSCFQRPKLQLKTNYWELVCSSMSCVCIGPVGINLNIILLGFFVLLVAIIRRLRVWI